MFFITHHNLKKEEWLKYSPFVHQFLKKPLFFIAFRVIILSFFSHLFLQILNIFLDFKKFFHNFAVFLPVIRYFFVT